MSERVIQHTVTDEMKKTYTLLFPNMVDIHFHILQNILKNCGYHVELLTNTSENILEVGQKYVHNDTCYPALLTIGQMICALQSGKYDLDHTILVMSQTGGGCRASNYIYLLKKALMNAGFEKVPVLSFNLSNLMDKNGIHLSIPTLLKMLAAMEYGDLLLLLSQHIRPYEVEKGATDSLVNVWIDKISSVFEEGKGCSFKDLKKYNSQIVQDFSKIEITSRDTIRVGVVGEIYVKFSSLANNDLVRFLESQGCEVMVPGIMNFLLYALDMPMEDVRLYGGNKVKNHIGEKLFSFILKFESIYQNAVQSYFKLQPYAELKKSVSPYLGTGCKMGEGWLLVAETLELLDLNFKNIICVQPFGCLPNHIVGKGMMKKICSQHMDSNIVAIDYDPGTSRVNQENRIRLMLAIAKEKKEES